MKNALLPRQIRNNTIKVLAEDSIIIPSGLPLLDENISVRSKDELTGRMISLFVVVIFAMHDERDVCIQWLEDSGFDFDLTDSERKFLYKGIGNKRKFQLEEDCLYALSYILGICDTIDYYSIVPKNVVRTFPDISISGSELEFIKQFEVVSDVELFNMLDLYYCLDWYCIESIQKFGTCKISPFRIKERRKALEWALYSELIWDEMQLDT